MKKLITILLLISTTLVVAAPTVVLPERFLNSAVVVENSPKFQALVAQNKQLAKQVEAEKKAKKDFKDQVDQQLRDKQTELNRALAENTELKATQSHSRWGIFGTLFDAFGLAVSFFGNPFSFIITRLVELGLGLVAVFVFVTLVRFLWRRWKNNKWKLKLPNK